MVGNLIYAMLCTRPDICFTVGMMSRDISLIEAWSIEQRLSIYSSILENERLYVSVSLRWIVTPWVYKLRLQSNRDSHGSTSNFVFTLGGGAVNWRSLKQSCIVNSTMEVQYVVVSEVAKEVIWFQKFLLGIGLMPLVVPPLVLFCDNSGAMAQSKEQSNHRKGKHIEMKYHYHLIHDIVMREDVVVENIISTTNLADPNMKTLSTKVFDHHRDSLGVRCVPKG